MERISKANLVSLSLIGFGLLLLALAAAELLRPRLSVDTDLPVDPPPARENPATARVLPLLAGDADGVSGIDRGALTARNPFLRPAPPPTPPPEPAPEPPPEPPPPPPKTRELPVVYRGLYRSSTGEAFVYLELEGATRVFEIDATVAPGWRIVEADRNQLTLQRGAKPALNLRFNEKKSLEVPIR